MPNKNLEKDLGLLNTEEAGVHAPEISVSPQKEMEKTPEKEEGEKIVEITEKAIKAKKKRPTLSFKKKPTKIPQVRDETTIKIEQIMEEGLGDAFDKLSPIAKQEFKLKGEQTAVKIRELVGRSHIKAKKIFSLILEWLKILPGVNKFFLEQEAKIKTDRIIGLKK